MGWDEGFGCLHRAGGQGGVTRHGKRSQALQATVRVGPRVAYRTPSESSFGMMPCSPYRPRGSRPTRPRSAGRGTFRSRSGGSRDTSRGPRERAPRWRAAGHSRQNLRRQVQHRWVGVSMHCGAGPTLGPLEHSPCMHSNLASCLGRASGGASARPLPPAKRRSQSGPP